jgi:hypothetical protein
MSMEMRAVFAAAVLATLSTPSLADSDEAKIKMFEAQIQTLQARIAALEAHHTFTSFMPDFAERFHVMHRAGDVSDWAVASHQLSELRRITKLSTSVDAEKGKLMQEMMEPSFEALENAIGHGNHGKFQKALVQATNTCNACHTATGSGFVQVTLDADESLSIRHPHKFTKQKMVGGHTH